MYRTRFGSLLGLAVAAPAALLALSAGERRPAPQMAAAADAGPTEAAPAGPAAPSGADQTTSPPGSPGAATTISGQQLPAPDPQFGGEIKQQALQSKPWWAPRIVPPKQAPNILLIITDDAGFGVPSTFGGVIPTPTLDRIAASGLRYNNIHSTALCSPTRAALITGRNHHIAMGPRIEGHGTTRAALITGRNHHSAGFGVISEQSTGLWGYNSIIG